jgi:hypothetical protein
MARRDLEKDRGEAGGLRLKKMSFVPGLGLGIRETRVPSMRFLVDGRAKPGHDRNGG